MEVTPRELTDLVGLKKKEAITFPEKPGNEQRRQERHRKTADLWIDFQNTGIISFYLLYVAACPSNCSNGGECGPPCPEQCCNRRDLDDDDQDEK